MKVGDFVIALKRRDTVSYIVSGIIVDIYHHDTSFWQGSIYTLSNYQKFSVKDDLSKTTFYVNDTVISNIPLVKSLFGIEVK